MDSTFRESSRDTEPQDLAPRRRFSQDQYLEELRHRDTQTLVTLMNGKHVSGKIECFDKHTILFTSRPGKRGRQYLIFKHAIASITTLPTGRRAHLSPQANDTAT